MITRYERCPICNEYLWLEWGYWSFEECIFWDFYLYPTYANRMRMSHYREVGL